MIRGLCPEGAQNEKTREGKQKKERKKKKKITQDKSINYTTAALALQIFEL